MHSKEGKQAYLLKSEEVHSILVPEPFNADWLQIPQATGVYPNSRAEQQPPKSEVWVYKENDQPGTWEAEVDKFDVSLVSIESFRLARAIQQDPVSKQNKKERKGILSCVIRGYEVE